MLLRLYNDWLCDANQTYANQNSCKVNLQDEKEFYKGCCQSVENCDNLVDSFIRVGKKEYACKVFESLILWKNAIKRRDESQKRIELYYGIILMYESWLSKCS